MVSPTPELAMQHPAPARDESFCAGAGLDTRELRDAAEAERERRHEQRRRQTEEVRSNLGLGHDLRAGLIDPTPDQLDALLRRRRAAEHPNAR